MAEGLRNEGTTGWTGNLPERSARVLLVDDEPNILRSLKRMLMEEPVDVLTAQSGEEGLTLLKHHPDIGLIISDQRMPGMLGAEFLSKAKEIAPDAIRMILTGHADIQAAIDAINMGEAYRYISKPWKDEELIQVIRDALHRYALIQENKMLTEKIKQQNEELNRWNDQLQYFVQEQTIEIQNKNKELQSLNRKLRANFDHTIQAFSELIELRDRRVKNHSKNVAELSRKMAVKMGMGQEEVDTLYVAALLHDIGKIGMPDALLLIECKDMTPEELKEYQLHPIRGQTAIDKVEDLRNAGKLIRQHHEWLNGEGFPDGLRGDSIALGARIIALANFADRLFTQFQERNGQEVVLNQVRAGSGKRFDPHLLPCFEEAFKETYKAIPVRSEATEKELLVSQLKVGMILSRDVRSGTGLLLLSKGTELSEKNIESLKRYFQLDPSKGGVFVFNVKG
ncbi:MAG: response regulator [Desulfobacterota bacterium]|nr:response regulator [Thermodesulfobacteriota bacterium]